MSKAAKRRADTALMSWCCSDEVPEEVEGGRVSPNPFITNQNLLATVFFIAASRTLGHWDWCLVILQTQVTSVPHSL